ncbi:hypothetical protein KKF34_13715 [Myxococcota bacterium]|nr:hypothetical protein [Myxococcota bacterium]MBU1379373.1 hypothetical protein [Myxococcota bacterium]MBU1497928.1 hypothetical protein [Myxococcota bacterium]
MKSILTGLLIASFALVGCKKGKEEKKEEKNTVKVEKKVEVEKPKITPPVPARKAPEGQTIEEFCKEKPKVIEGKTKKFKKHAKMEKLIKACASKCKDMYDFKCKQYKELDQWVTDVWMNKIKMKKEERLEAYVTAINLLLDKDKKVAAAAIKGVINGYLYRHEWLVEKPEVLGVKYIRKMLKAVDNMTNSSDMGFLIQGAAELAPAFGITDEVFKKAKEFLPKNKDLISYALKNMPKYGNACLITYVKEYAGDMKNILHAWSAVQAASVLVKNKIPERHKFEICTWSDSLIPEKISKEVLENREYGYFAYRYFDLVQACKRYEAIPNLKKLLEIKDKDTKKKAEKVIAEMTALLPK